jgi:hypothetical protein
MHIACHRSHLEERCQERGYTLEQVMGCVVSQDGDVWTIDPDHKSYPRTKPGLGDRVEGVLKSVGITQGRVSRLIGRPCGCEGRKKLLNNVGKRLGIG